MNSFPTHPSVRDGDAWWKGAVIYQIYPRSFVDSNGDGIGDLKGIISKLDYLRDLGVDALWLNPICVSPQDDNGYDISDYEDIDPTFGTLADYDALIAGAHERGIRIIMDLVLNHSSDEHPWFIESRSGKDSPKRDWYYWRPARQGHEPGTPGAEPNNWGSLFSGPAWEYDPPSGEYYLHLFSRKQPDLNWENPDVRAAIFAMINRWQERGVDGFRLDAINFISKVEGLPDGFQADGEQFGFAFPQFVDGPRIHEFMHLFHEAALKGRDGMAVGEMGGTTVEEARLYTDEAREELDMVFQFDHMIFDRNELLDVGLDAPTWELGGLKETLGGWQHGLNDVGWNSLYWNNHDQPRVVSRFGNDGEYRERSAKLLATILHLMKGTPYVYQGEEIGMTNYPWSSIAEFNDIRAVNAYAAVREQPGFDEAKFIANLGRFSRDNGRTPMQWNAEPGAGFTSGTPWLAIHPNASEVNVEAALADPDSVLAHYRALIDLRHRLPLVVYGRFDMLLPDDERIFAYTRTDETHEMLVVGNFSDEPADAALDASWLSAELLISNIQDDPSTFTLQPWEARAYLRERQSA